MRVKVLRGAVLASVAGAITLLIPAASLAAFPGSNGRIAYSHQVDQSSAAIYSVSPSGATPTNLSAVGAGTTMTADFQPAWSANGKQIAFVRVDRQHCSGQIWTMRQNGTGQTNLSNDGASANEINPAYGPDGSIVFVRAPAGTFNICTNSPVNQGNLWVRRPNGSLRQLTTDGADNTPAWSPDGSKIAFTRVAHGSPPHIFVVNANGSGTPTDLGAGLKPNWSPDGSKIAFAAPGGPNGPSGGPVTVMNKNGGDRKTLNPNGTAPVWSPDATKIAYVGFDQATNSSVIGVMNANGQNQHNVTSPGKGNNDVKPDWAPVLKNLKLTVSPRTVIAGTHACFAFHASSNGHAVAQVRIVFAHRQAHTSHQGRAQICLTLGRGRHTATGTKTGYQVAATSVRARHAVRRPPPKFTG